MVLIIFIKPDVTHMVSLKMPDEIIWNLISTQVLNGTDYTIIISEAK